MQRSPARRKGRPAGSCRAVHGGEPARYDQPVEPAVAAYELIDAGEGRRLERFGAVVLDRPAPGTAGTPRRDPGAWANADARFDRAEGANAGAWLPGPPPRWMIIVDDVTLEIRPTPAGSVGFFPEHVEVARWAADRARAVAAGVGRPAVVLNLFAHTGLATLTLARAGALVVHVDASRPAVAWARRNAELSGLADRPIRWLVDDAGDFVAREARRGRRYDGVLLDPPTYGHGPRGTAWRLEDDLRDLLAAVRVVLAEGRWFVACTAHAAGLPGATLEGIVQAGLGVGRGSTELRELALVATSGGRLAAGWVVLAEAGLPGTRP
jgi:23S rRNA (cytosine1962-C5)-methyltransferase